MRRRFPVSLRFYFVRIPKLHPVGGGADTGTSTTGEALQVLL